MDVTVRLFASLREHAGSGTLRLELGDGATVADAIAELRRGALAGLPDNAPFVTAVAREYVKTDHALAAGDELALVPPVSGGAPEAVRLADVVDETIDVEAVRRSVADPATGATVVFMGTTRDVPSLEYEAYVDMAREQIAQIASRVVDEHGCVAVACVHRVGVVPLGDPSVVVAASAAHRAEAFEGARALLDAVKAQAPIWKKEHYEDGDAAWVEGTLPQA
ncbi:MAG: MoaE-MoaD fusion protein [Solirubrobacteraceae bacterium]|jgi:molybdopterin synthase catalytic subunit|nr:MoaE-MoaD fusion protein [Solirubrobacteraceae bacterium]MEA2138242.1 MoaE-MoaD fusion protein [Solirubrobacteraceae bacterium]